MEKFGNKQKYTWILLIGTLAVYFFMRFFFTISLPFLLALIVVWKVYPYLNRLSKKTRLKETWILVFVLLVLICLLLGILYVPLSYCFEDMDFLKEDESILDSQLLDTCVEKYMEFKETCSEYVGEDVVIKIQTGTVKCAKSCVTFFTYLIIFLVSLILFCKDFGKIKGMIEGKEDNTLVQVVRGVISYVKAFLKTQVIIFLVLSALIGVALGILQIENSWLLGLLAGLLDAFPFVGTGIVLVPLAIWLFLKGQILKAVLCLFLYGICALIRELFEPKLIGEKVGIYPIVLFASVFVGMYIFGVGGIIKGPLSVVILYELHKVLLAKKEKL